MSGRNTEVVSGDRSGGTPGPSFVLTRISSASTLGVR
jgi:hypothetical protein